jgi:hypothetical protein
MNMSRFIEVTEYDPQAKEPRKILVAADKVGVLTQYYEAVGKPHRTLIETTCGDGANVTARETAEEIRSLVDYAYCEIAAQLAELNEMLKDKVIGLAAKAR